MERVRIADVNHPPYDSARMVFETNNKDERSPPNAPVDLLRTVAFEKSRQNNDGNTGNMLNPRNSTKHNQDYSLYGGEDQDHSVSYGGDLNQIYNRRRADNPNRLYSHHNANRPLQDYASENGRDDNVKECAYQSLSCTEDHFHLCHKHAREWENQTNNIYNCINTLQRQYDSKNTTIRKSSLKKTTNVRDLMYFSHAKILKEQKTKGDLGKSTQSLPAVTYNTKDENNKGLWSNTTLLPKQKWPSKTKSLDSYYKESARCPPVGVKRLLIILCIVIGILLTLTGTVIGFTLLSRKTSAQGSTCKEGHVDCGDGRCVTYTDICDSSLLQQCPVFVSTLCSQLKAASVANDTISSAEQLPSKDETRIHVDIIYDERGWAHFTNSSGKESKYKVLHTVTTYSSAQAQCMRLGGHLAHITSIREQLFLEQFLRVQTEVNDETPEIARGFWIGARRARGSHSGTCMLTQWRWLDPHGRPLSDITSFNAFAVGKPDNYYKPEECLYMTTSNHFGENSFLKWDDIPCDMLGMGELLPLCEVDLRNYQT